jgi:hypothetical protein
MTQYFRTEQLSNGRWILRDPSYKPFYSLGVNCVWNQLIDQQKRLQVDLVGKYGSDERWFERWAEAKLSQIEEYGFNTLGAWHEKVYWGANAVPKTIEVRLSKYAFKVNTDWGVGFPDVFDSSFVASIHRVLIECFYEKGASLRDDPSVIGFFTDNELHWWGKGGTWGNDDPTNHQLGLELVEDYISLGPDQAGKIAWVNFLEEKYGSIETLNEAWNSEYVEFGDLRYIAVYRVPNRILNELKAHFLRTIAETYFRTTSSILKMYAPNHLNLGCRMVGTSTPLIVLEVAKQYVDMFSFNFYNLHLPDQWLDHVYEVTGKPAMVTEFSFCAGREAGFLHNTNGARKVIVRNQRRRGETYRDFVFECARKPYMVGSHWFALYDYANPNGLIGNYGLMNLADEPYKEFTEMVCNVHRDLEKELAVHASV